MQSFLMGCFAGPPSTDRRITCSQARILRDAFGMRPLAFVAASSTNQTGRALSSFRAHGAMPKSLPRARRLAT